MSIKYSSLKNNHTEKLAYLKKNVETWNGFFTDNVKRYHEFRNSIFSCSLSESQKSLLNSLNKPIIEFNVLEAYISRLIGEFAKQEPSIDISCADGSKLPTQVLYFVESHLRHILYEAQSDSTNNKIYQDILSGGFSCFKIWTDYESPLSFKQKIFIGRVFDPTLVGFDPMAREKHKGDGQFSFELFPLTEDVFASKYPNIDIKGSCNSTIENFSWTYKNNQNIKIILICEYFEKKRKKGKIVELSDGTIKTIKQYEEMKKKWDDDSVIEQIPSIIKTRTTEFEIICRYEFTNDILLNYQETDFTYLPHIFVDGNSIELRQGTSNCIYQMTRPYVYHAKGMQDLKNYSGQALADSLENMVQHKFIVMKEALPQEKVYLDALSNIQKANTIVVNAYSEENPDQPIPNPIREVNLVPAPPEVMGTFIQSDQTIQSILGSYASNLGRNDEYLSGKAIIESASVGNSASMPYIMSFLAALERVALIAIDLMPKYLVERNRALPITNLDGSKGYTTINDYKDPNSPKIDYASTSIKVNISAGVNFQVQKNQALTQIVQLMGASPIFNEFMNSEKGLPILIKNLTIHGADELQEAIPFWQKEKKEKEQQAIAIEQQNQQQNPQIMQAQIEAQKIQLQMQEMQLKSEQNKIQAQLDIAKLAIEKQLADAKIMQAESSITQEQINSAVRLEEAQTSIEVHALDKAAKMAEIKSREHMAK